MCAPARPPSAISRLTSLRKPRPFSPSYSKPREFSVIKKDSMDRRRLFPFQNPFKPKYLYFWGLYCEIVSGLPNVCYARVFWGSAKRENGHWRCGIRRLSRKCLVIVAPNTKTRNEGNRVGRPLSFDRSATIIGRLGHHVETRNRKPAGTSMATCVLPICSARQHETSVILFFFSREPSFYTVTHFPIRAFGNSTNG